MGLTPEVLEPVVRAALAEDVGSGDVTTESVVPADARCRATLELEEPGVVCGVPAVRAVFEALDPDVTVRALLDDHKRVVILAIHNSDISDGWEREGENELYFNKFSEKVAYPLGINIIFYMMTH